MRHWGHAFYVITRIRQVLHLDERYSWVTPNRRGCFPWKIVQTQNSIHVIGHVQRDFLYLENTVILVFTELEMPAHCLVILYFRQCLTSDHEEHCWSVMILNLLPIRNNVTFGSLPRWPWLPSGRHLVLFLRKWNFQERMQQVFPTWERLASKEVSETWLQAPEGDSRPLQVEYGYCCLSMRQGTEQPGCW